MPPLILCLSVQNMPKKAKGSTGPGRRGTHSHKSKKTHKVSVRQQFLTRHIDQVWEDVRQTASVHDGKTGPLGTTSRSVDTQVGQSSFTFQCSQPPLPT